VFVKTLGYLQTAQRYDPDVHIYKRSKKPEKQQFSISLRPEDGSDYFREI
jgi:hypothetical protein